MEELNKLQTAVIKNLLEILNRKVASDLEMLQSLTSLLNTILYHTTEH